MSSKKRNLIAIWVLIDIACTIGFSFSIMKIIYAPQDFIKPSLLLIVYTVVLCISFFRIKSLNENLDYGIIRSDELREKFTEEATTICQQLNMISLLREEEELLAKKKKNVLILHIASAVVLVIYAILFILYSKTISVTVRTNVSLVFIGVWATVFICATLSYTSYANTKEKFYDNKLLSLVKRVTKHSEYIDTGEELNVIDKENAQKDFLTNLKDKESIIESYHTAQYGERVHVEPSICVSIENCNEDNVSIAEVQCFSWDNGRTDIGFVGVFVHFVNNEPRINVENNYFFANYTYNPHIPLFKYKLQTDNDDFNKKIQIRAEEEINANYFFDDNMIAKLTQLLNDYDVIFDAVIKDGHFYMRVFQDFLICKKRTVNNIAFMLAIIDFCSRMSEIISEKGKIYDRD